MSEWKQISWRDAVDKKVFDDELGFVHVNSQITYSVGQQEINGYYEENSSGQKTRISDATNLLKVKALFSKTIYQAKTDYYGRSTSFIPIEVQTINPVISYRCPWRQNNGYGYSNSVINHSFPIGKKDKNRLDYLRYVWICDEIQDNVFKPDGYLKQPLLKNLKIGANFFGDKGRGKITKIYPQPNENDLMFQATLDFEGCDKTPFDVSFNDKIYVLPYHEQPISETAQFNESKNEIWLSPYAEQGETWEFGSSSYGHGCSKIHCVNVYWNKISDAAQYVISLYKKFDRPYLQSLYHIKDFAVDRNEGFLSIENLIGDGFIVTVKAENRNGEEIALSRGIKLSGEKRGDKQCLPQYFKDE